MANALPTYTEILSDNDFDHAKAQTLKLAKKLVGATEELLSPIEAAKTRMGLVAALQTLFGLAMRFLHPAPTAADISAAYASVFN